MRMTVAAAIAAMAAGTACLSAGAQAQTGGIECDAFVKRQDGSWSATRDVELPGPGRNVKIRQGSLLRPGATIMGTDFAEMLDQTCPASAAMPDPQTQVEITKFADPGGNIDIQKLTCGQLTNTYQEDADFVLAWYSGWSNGVAKLSAINMPRLKEGIHSVIVYCKANKDKLVSQAIDVVSRQR